MADDHTGVLEAARLLFKANGHTTITADSPGQVLELTSADEFDLLLIDLNYARDTTSGAEGLDLLGALRRSAVASPVVVMTAWGSIELAVEAMRAGASDFVQKPWDNARLLQTIESEVHRARTSRSDLEIARNVQSKLLPDAPPRLEGIDCAARCVPARGVGGDYFDWFDLGHGELGFVMADVSGKGIGAALLMAHLRGGFHTRLSMPVSSTPDLIAAVNREFWASTAPEHYATLLFGRYQASTRALRYVSAGHPAPLIFRSDGGIEALEATSVPIGLFPEWHSRERLVTLSPGDIVVICSDGVLEAGMSHGDGVGAALVGRAVRAWTAAHAKGLSGATVDQLVSQICTAAATADPQQHDDCTVMALRLAEPVIPRS